MYEESVKMLASRLKLRNTSILVTGATGLIGSCVIDVLAKANDEYGLKQDCTKEEIRKAIANGTVMKYLQKVPIHKAEIK